MVGDRIGHVNRPSDSTGPIIVFVSRRLLSTSPLNRVETAPSDAQVTAVRWSQPAFREPRTPLTGTPPAREALLDVETERSKPAP
jgi:hypothetical protein